ncbi:unnamed protein product [Cuscuta epithymum]|uniref:Coiled-coil domain-containing protein n=1 Tax=Cuscuta epithymum TaxID=186058 RepID=A0AAV0CR46_9ASTE|nr:unnamed protein product [Cuscuta epithymum]CAH9137706.1 unnamed protein product [Cuscuta epithymum]
MLNTKTVNSYKTAASKARKAAAESQRKAREERDKEDRFWREAEGTKSRAAKKREEEAERRAEAAAKKAEARRLADQEARELARSLQRNKKVTEAELRRRREEEQAAVLRRAEEEKRRQGRRVTAEEEYERIVLVRNTNRDGSVIDARSVEEALYHMMGSPQNLTPERHPERSIKASFKAFEKNELPVLKEEKPGLTLTQYKDMIWKVWKKCGDSPLNKTPWNCRGDLPYMEDDKQSMQLRKLF